MNNPWEVVIYKNMKEYSVSDWTFPDLVSAEEYGVAMVRTCSKTPDPFSTEKAHFSFEIRRRIKK